MAWQTPKTDWTPDNNIKSGDFNRIEGNIALLRGAISVIFPDTTLISYQRVGVWDNADFSDTFVRWDISGNVSTINIFPRCRVVLKAVNFTANMPGTILTVDKTVSGMTSNVGSWGIGNNTNISTLVYDNASDVAANITLRVSADNSYINSNNASATITISMISV